MLVTFNRAIAVGCLCLLFAAHISAQIQQGRTIKKAFIPREPVKVLEVKVGEQSVRLDTSFFDNENWLKGLQLKLKNISGKTIQYIEVEIIIPESITKDNPLVMPISYGKKQPDEVATTGSKSVLDGDSVVLVLPDAGYDSIRNFLTNKNGNTIIDNIELRIGMIIFSNGTAWREGSILHRDPKNPDNWVVPPKYGISLLPDFLLQQKNGLLGSPFLLDVDNIHAQGLYAHHRAKFLPTKALSFLAMQETTNCVAYTGSVSFSCGVQSPCGGQFGGSCNASYDEYSTDPYHMT